MEKQRVLPVRENEFLIHCHRVLNSPKLDVERCIGNSLELEQYLNGRKPIPYLEGDLAPVKETGEVVFAHKGLFSLSDSEYKHLRKTGVAVALAESLDKIAAYKQRDPNQKVGIFLI